MSRHKQPEDWAKDVPTHEWPDTLVSEVRRDPGALASRRVIRTIRRWRAEAADATDRARQSAARDHLWSLAHALMSPDGDIPTTMLEPPIPSHASEDPEGTGREASDLANQSTDSRIAALSSDRTQIKASRPPPRRPASRERAVLQPDPPRPLTDPPPIAPEHATRMSSEFGEATRHLAKHPLPIAPDDAPEAHRGASETAGRGLSIVADPIGTPEVVEAYRDPGAPSFADASEHPTRAAPMPTLPPGDDEDDDPSPANRSIPPPPPPMSRVVRVTTSDRNQPKPHGVVQRSALQPQLELTPPRPRASIMQVEPLYRAIEGLCHELVPLSTERRSRRFWTHWRERSGGKGVDRENVEALLCSCTEARALAAKLIAEVHDVDPNSVMALLDKLDDVSRAPDAPQRVGSVKVQGISPED